jgi:hypothetical protein
MKYLITITVDPTESPAPADLASKIAEAVAATTQALPEVKSVTVGAVQTDQD